MTWLVWSIIGFGALCGLAAFGFILAGRDDDRMANDWWRDQ